MRSRIVTATALVAIACVTGAVVALALRPARASRAHRASGLATATVRRGNLLQAQQVTGSLGYGSAWTVTGRGAGTITWLPAAGATVNRGQQLYRVDDAPVTLFYGGLPLYRTLRYAPGASATGTASTSTTGTAGDASGSGGAAGGRLSGKRGPAKPPPAPPQTGHDVQLVAANLAALGFYGGDPAYASYDAYLADAVKAWQRAIGAPVTGVISPAQVVVSSGPVRINEVLARVDDTAGEQILKLTGTTKLITLRLPLGLAQSLTRGRRLAITLPDGVRVEGRVARIESSGDSLPGGSGAGTQSVPVSVRALHPAALSRAALGSVVASVVTASRRNVLYVPITALLALSGGGYALQRPDHTLLPVRIGMVTDGDVQVTGVAAGVKVLVAQ